MQLLKINGIDFSKYINESSYKVARQSVYEEWTDANYRIHRSEYRQRIIGSFDMVFTTEAEYNSFVDQINKSNYVRMTVYVGGMTNQNIDSGFYFSIETSSHRSINESHVFNKLSVKIEEA